MNNWQLLKARWKSETTKFWETVGKIARRIGYFTAAMLAADLLIPSEQFDLPNGVTMALGFITCFCAGIAGSAKFTTSDPNLQEETPK